MYTGHLAVALGARGLHARTPLWSLVLAAQAPDWIAIVLGAAGIADPTELWSHSLPAIAIGAALCASLCRRATGSRHAALVIGGVYLTHPALDLVTGLKPTWGGGPKLGMCLYDWPGADFLTEGALVLMGIALYRQSLRTPHQRTVPGLMLVLLLLCQAGADVLQARRLGTHGANHAGPGFLRCRAPDDGDGR